MNRILEKYLKVSNIAFMNTMEYRLDFLFDLISKFFPAIIQFFMWTAIFHNSPDKIIMNYTYHEMILYTVISIFVSSLISVNIHWGIAQDIKNGSLSKYIILPIGYFFYKVFQFIGSKISDIILISVGIVIVFFLFYKKNIISINPLQVVLFLVVALLSLILQYLIYYTISGVAFWIGDCGGIFTVVNVISLVISGAVFPLDIFGDFIVKLSQLFPFYYITYFPTNVLIGKASGIQVLNAIPIMGIWIGVFILFSKLIWNTGMKKYIAAGG